MLHRSCRYLYILRMTSLCDMRKSSFSKKTLPLISLMSVLFIILCCSSIHAAEFNISVTDAEGTPLMNYYATLHITREGNDAKRTTTSYLFDTLRIAFLEGDQEAALLLNDPSTPGGDYYARFILQKEGSGTDSSSSASVVAYPVGSVSGVIIDALSNVVSDADLKFQCDGDYGLVGPSMTDAFGSFSYKWAPAGKCRMQSRRTSI